MKTITANVLSGSHIHIRQQTCLLVLSWIALTGATLNSAQGQNASKSDTQPRFSMQTLFDSARIMKCSRTH
jgi:hypothetical protein